MFRDNKAFRERFQRWKLGELVYENGRPLPAYEGGKIPEYDFSELLKKAALKQQYDPITKDLNSPMSPVDPVGEAIVSGAALGPVFGWVGGKLLNAVGKYGGAVGLKKLGNWARAKAMSKSMNESIKSTNITGTIDLQKPTITSGISKQQIINPMTLSLIDYFKNLGVSGISDNITNTNAFRELFGMNPVEWKKYWTDLYKSKGLSENIIQRNLNRLYESELKRAQSVLNDITKIKNQNNDNNLRIVKDTRRKLLNLLLSDAYKSRLFEDGYGKETALQFIDEQIKSINNAPVFLQNNVLLNPSLLEKGIIAKQNGASGAYYPEKHLVLVLNDIDNKHTVETIGHELIHASDNGLGVRRANHIYDKLKAKENSIDPDYYNLETERRTRILEPLSDAFERGYDINNYDLLWEYLASNNNVIGNHNIKSVLKNYDIKITDLLDVLRYGYSLAIPTIIGGDVYSNISENNTQNELRNK